MLCRIGMENGEVLLLLITTEFESVYHNIVCLIAQDEFLAVEVFVSEAGFVQNGL